MCYNLGNGFQTHWEVHIVTDEQSVIVIYRISEVYGLSIPYSCNILCWLLVASLELSKVWLIGCTCILFAFNDGDDDSKDIRLYVRPVLVITLSEGLIDGFLPNFGHVCILQGRWTD